MSSLSTYTVVEVNKSYAVINWIESKAAPKQLVVALLVYAQSKKYGTVYTTYATNTDNILINNLKPYDTYELCFLPVPLRGKLESNCEYLPNKFKTAEGGEQ